MADEPLLITRPADGVVVLSNNDDPLNRMSLEWVAAMSEAIDEVAADDSVRAVVITAEGTTNFSVGMNLKQLGPGIQAAGSIDAFFDERLDLIHRIETMPKPSIATLFGHCLGGGLELPLGCTFRVAAAEGASIGLPEMHLGSTPAWGGSARLAKAVGTTRALELILRARTLTGPEALEIGLVQEVWPVEELRDRAVAFAADLAAQPRLAVRAMLEALRDASRRNLDDLLAAERAAVHATMGTPDAAEGMRAFLEKRPPRFNQD